MFQRQITDSDLSSDRLITDVAFSVYDWAIILCAQIDCNLVLNQHLCFRVDHDLMRLEDVGHQVISLISTFKRKGQGLLSP